MYVFDILPQEYFTKYTGCTFYHVLLENVFLESILYNLL